MAAKASLAPEPACGTWRMSTDPATRSGLDTSANGTHSSRDTSGSDRADSHNGNSNTSFSGAGSEDAICGFQELAIWGFVGDTHS